MPNSHWIAPSILSADFARLGEEGDAKSRMFATRLGSILGSVLGAAFIVLLPIFLNQALPPLGALFAWKISTATVSNFESMIFGALIVFFLIVEPNGLARLWQTAKQKLRVWPFPY